MKIYIASSWKNQHAVEMLTALIRERGHEVLSFVENSFGERNFSGLDSGGNPQTLAAWIKTPGGEEAFVYDTSAATQSNLVVYLGPSGIDAWAEVGAAFGAGVPIIGLHAKQEQVGLMRRMVAWVESYQDILAAISSDESPPIEDPQKKEKKDD